MYMQVECKKEKIKMKYHVLLVFYIEIIEFQLITYIIPR